MKRLPAFKVASVTVHRIMAFLESDLASHGGDNNGELKATHKQLTAFGIHHNAIGPGIREGEALGFWKITQPGIAGNADFRRPTLFRLTYVLFNKVKPTDDWRNIATVEEAETIAREARNVTPRGYPRRPVKRGLNGNSQYRKTRKPIPETGSGNAPFSLPETGSGNGKSPHPETGSTIYKSSHLTLEAGVRTGSGDGVVVPIKQPWTTPAMPIEITDPAVLAIFGVIPKNVA
jgi:hypothetical protein